MPGPAVAERVQGCRAVGRRYRSPRLFESQYSLGAGRLNASGAAQRVAEALARDRTIRVLLTDGPHHYLTFAWVDEFVSTEEEATTTADPGRLMVTVDDRVYYEYPEHLVDRLPSWERTVCDFVEDVVWRIE